METIFLNYKDIQFLIGCTPIETKHEILKRLPFDEKSTLIDLSELTKNSKSKYKEPCEFIKAAHVVDINSFDIKMTSFSDELHGQNTIQYTVQKMRESGISDTMKHGVLEDVTNILKETLSGKWETLKRILNKEQIESLENSLKYRKKLYLNSCNKVPKNLIRYAKQ